MISGKETATVSPQRSASQPTVGAVSPTCPTQPLRGATCPTEGRSKPLGLCPQPSLLGLCPQPSPQPSLRGVLDDQRQGDGSRQSPAVRQPTNRWGCVPSHLSPAILPQPFSGAVSPAILILWGCVPSYSICPNRWGCVPSHSPSHSLGLCPQLFWCPQPFHFAPAISAKALFRLYFDCKRNRLWVAICFYDTSGDTFDGVAFHRLESERQSRQLGFR